MKFRLLKRWHPFIVLLLLLIFYAVNNYIWLNLNEFPPFAGQAYHLLRSLDYSKILTHPSKHMLTDISKVDSLRPPFFHLCMAIGNIICDNFKVAPIMTNIFFAVILFFSIYYIGEKLQGKTMGLLAVFIIAMYPYVFGLSRMAKTHFASMALVCLSVSLLLYTDRFRRVLPSIFLGLIIGLGMLTRIQFIFFVMGPFITMIIIALSDKELISIKKRLIFNLSLAAIIAILVAGIWYFPKPSFLLKTYLYPVFISKFPTVVSPKLFSLPYFTFYLWGLINGQITPLFTLFFLIALFRFLNKKKLNFLLFSWIIVTYFTFTLIKFKEVRNTSEYLPAFALVTAGGILLLRKEWLKRCLISIIIFGGLCQYFIISFTNPSCTHIRLSFFTGRLTEGLTISSYLYPLSEVFFHYPRKGDWKINDVILAIQKEIPAYDKNVTIGVTDAYIDVKTDWFDPFKLDSWHENFVTTNVDAINYFLRTNELSYKVISLSSWKEDWRYDPSLAFIISVKQIENLAPLISQQYKLIFQTEVPDGSPIYVYKKVSIN